MYRVDLYLSEKERRASDSNRQARIAGTLSFQDSGVTVPLGFGVIADGKLYRVSA